MKRITITLTEDQLREIYRVLEWGYDYENTIDDEQRHYHAFLTRLRNKIKAELVKL